MTSRLVSLLLLLPSLALAEGDPENGRKLGKTCVACHGLHGNTPQPDWPKLGGQRAPYLAKQILDFQRNRRRDQYMHETSRPLSAQDIDDLAAWYASQPLTSVDDAEGDPVGRALYADGDLERGVPACAACHGADARGADQGGPGGIPSIAGQHQEWTVRALRTLASGSRDNDHLDMMGHVALKLEPEDAAAIARYLETLH